MDVLGTVKIGGVGATEIKEILWITTVVDLSGAFAAHTTATATAVAVGVRAHHNIGVRAYGAQQSTWFPSYNRANFSANDLIVLTAQNNHSATLSAASAEKIWVEAWR
jgi:hypothetical protein